jgi:hypothetical protein
VCSILHHLANGGSSSAEQTAALLDRLLHHAYVVPMKGTQTVFAGHSVAGRLKVTIQGYTKSDFDLPCLDADFVDDEA